MLNGYVNTVISAESEQFLLGDQKQGSGDGTWKSLSGVQGITPVGGVRDNILQMLKHYDICETLFCPLFAVICPWGSHVTPLTDFIGL